MPIYYVAFYIHNIPYEHKYKVLGSMGQTKTTYKSTKVYTNFILILENPNGEIIDAIVTPSAFYQAEYNEYMYFRLEPRVSKMNPSIFVLENKENYKTITLIIAFIFSIATILLLADLIAIFK